MIDTTLESYLSGDYETESKQQSRPEFLSSGGTISTSSGDYAFDSISATNVTWVNGNAVNDEEIVEWALGDDINVENCRITISLT